jgi:hypothetical protein
LIFVSFSKILQLWKHVNFPLDKYFFSSGFGDHVGAQFPPMVLRQVNLLLVLLVCLRLPVPAPRIYFQTPWEYFGTQGAFRA